MTRGQLDAIRNLRLEADNLRTACIAAVGARALLHVAYDREVVQELPLEETILIATLESMP